MMEEALNTHHSKRLEKEKQAIEGLLSELNDYVS